MQLVEKLKAGNKSEFIIFYDSALGATPRISLVFDGETDTDDAVGVPVEAQGRSVHSGGVLLLGNP